MSQRPLFPCCFFLARVSKLMSQFGVLGGLSVALTPTVSASYVTGLVGGAGAFRGTVTGGRTGGRSGAILGAIRGAATGVAAGGAVYLLGGLCSGVANSVASLAGASASMSYPVVGVGTAVAASIAAIPEDPNTVRNSLIAARQNITNLVTTSQVNSACNALNSVNTGSIL
jgi:hypothetical protein